MKYFVLPILLLLFTTSCKKWKDDKYTYYSEDYVNADMTLLGVHTSDIDALWVEMADEDKDKDVERYTLYVKSDGVIHNETGTIISDWATTIKFIPSNGDMYVGEFQQDKGTYVLSYDLEDRTEDLTFVYKHSCK